MTSLYDVQQVRGATESSDNRSASEAAACAEQSRRGDTIALADSPFTDAYEWMPSPIPASFSYNASSLPHSYPGYNSLDVMFGARSNTGLEGLFSSTFYPVQQARAYSNNFQKPFGASHFGEPSPASSYSVGSQSGSQASGSAASQPYSRPTHPAVASSMGTDGGKTIQRSFSYSSTASNDPMNVLAKSPEIVKFLEDNYERADESCSIPRCDLYNHYQQYCNETNQMITCQASFGKVIRQLFPWLKARRLGTRGKSKYHYCGIRQIRPAVPIHKLFAAQQSLSLPAGTMGAKTESYETLPEDGHSIYGADSKGSESPPMSRSVDAFSTTSYHAPAAYDHHIIKDEPLSSPCDDAESLAELYQPSLSHSRHFSLPTTRTDPALIDMASFTADYAFYHTSSPGNEMPAAPNDDLSLVNDFLH